MKSGCEVRLVTLVLLSLSLAPAWVFGKSIVSSTRTGSSPNDLEPAVGGSLSSKDGDLDTTAISEESTPSTGAPNINKSLNEVPTFNREQVSLAIPAELFSATANLTLQLRNFIGDLITRTSVRIAQVVRFFQPLFGYHLMIDIPKELDV
ncbi:uncharacterized protein LOC128728364 [Anopheles nili]|uniref:uncharacterized protein LOC128728364 n=1 Tax=Anopheles nili TaxID=185578 RepID=UPI00237AC8FE|nr:uncharacterized protein LOC128728364 [Anopheles nili]